MPAAPPGSSSRPSGDRSPRRRYHFGSAGIVYIVVTLLLALGAFNSGNNLLFWGFGFSLSMLIVSGLLSGAMLMGIDVRREIVGEAEVGGQLLVRYRVRNRNRLIPAFALSIDELPPAPPAVVGPAPTHNRATSPARTLSLLLSPRARRPAPPSLRIEQPRAFVAHIGPRESLVALARPRAMRRGAVNLRGFVVHTAFPFGLMRKSLLFSEPASTVIRPAPAPIDPAVLTETSGTGGADRSGRIRGPGDEFHSLREYNPGDNPRAIAWKASARRGTLLVRQSLAPSPRRVWIVLRLRIETDPARSETLDERAISQAVTAIRRAQSLGLAVGLAVPVARLIAPPNPHPAHGERLIRELGLLELGPADSRGVREPFPHIQSAREAGHCLCIHAGSIDSSFAPSDRVGRTTHIAADAVLPGPEAPSTQAAVTRPVRPRPPTRMTASA